MKYETVLHAICDHAKNNAYKLAVCELKKSVTYGEYWDNIRKTAMELMCLGIGKGDHVVIKATQTIDYLTVFSALQYVSAFPIPLEKTTNDDRMIEVAELTDAEYIITDKPIPEAKTQCLIQKEIVKNAVNAVPAELEMPRGGDLSMMLYTTGTTGSSKGVVMTHSADVAITGNVIEGVEMKENNVEVLPMPLNHSFALRRYMSTMVNGSTICLMDGVTFIGVLWKMFDKYGVTSMALAPAALGIIFQLSGDRLADYKEQIDYIQLGSAPLLEADKEHLLRILPDARMYNLYGSSEAGCACILNFNSPDNKPGCIGRPTVNSIIRFTDDDGKEVVPSEQQPALLSWGGPIVMEGYYKAPELTAETVENGFVRTKDLAYLDSEGRCILVGRADDVINFGGNKISPAEVEDVAMSYEGITDCAYAAKPDAVLGEVPMMLIVEATGYDEADFLAFLTERLEGYKIPRQIVVVNSLPKTFNGKLLRREVKTMIKEMIDGGQI